MAISPRLAKELTKLSIAMRKANEAEKAEKPSSSNPQRPQN